MSSLTAKDARNTKKRLFLLTTTQEGIKAYKNGDKVKAHQLFQQAVAQDKDDIQAWLGLAATTNSAEEKAAAYQHVLRREPENATAMKGLAQMVAQGQVIVRTPRQIAADNQAVEAENKSDSPSPSYGRDDERLIFAIRPSMVLISLQILATLVVLFVLAAFGISRNDPWGVRGLVVFIFQIIILAAILASTYAFALFYSTKYTLTSRKLTIESGVLGKSRRTIPVQRIQDVTLNQTWSERLLNIGDVVVESAGEFGAIKLKDVPDYQKHMRQLSQLIDEQHSSDGLGTR